jgi:hypothetical protein
VNLSPYILDRALLAERKEKEATTISKTIDRSIYLVAHEGVNPSNEDGFSQLSNHDYFIHEYSFMVQMVHYITTKQDFQLTKQPRQPTKIKMSTISCFGNRSTLYSRSSVPVAYYAHSGVN